jgi:arsenate reductase
MDLDLPVRVFGALGHAARLDVFRQLAREGEHGIAAGELAARCGLPASTLSFHLRDLCTAGLVAGRRTGRTIRYAVQREALNQVLWFLGEDCCQGREDLCPAPTSRIRARLSDASAMSPPAVLFVCSHNAARSQIAEALLRRQAGDRFQAFSAGMRPRAVHPLTIAVLAERGVPTDGLRAKDLGSLLGKHTFRHAIVLCPEAQADCPRTVPFAREVHFWPFPDPTAATGPERQRRAAFRAIRDAIEARLATWLAATSPSPTHSARPRRNRTA